MIYLDNAATSFPKPEGVYRALDSFARTSLANPGRGGHRMALAAERVLHDCRHRLNQLFHGSGPDRFILTLNCTDALNAAIKGTLKPGNHIITTSLEHNSVLRPLRALELAGTIKLTRVDADQGGTISPAAIQAALTPQTKLVAVTHASNVLGRIQPIAEIGSLVRRHGALFLVDAAQTAGVVPIDVGTQTIDLLAVPGHKSLFGPTGTGALYVGERADVRPWREGGTGGDSANETQPRELPTRLEAGTANVLGIAGLVAGLQFIAERGVAAIHEHEVKLAHRLRERLADIGGVQMFGVANAAQQVGLFSFRVEGLASAEVAGILDQSFDIAVRPGMHCAPLIHRALGSFPDGLVRVSPGPFNTADDIDHLADAIAEIAQ